jgi:hypothetical protein
VVRVTCAVLGLGILATLAVGSWRAAQAPYLEAAVAVPARMPVPASSLERPGAGILDPGHPPRRFQLRLFIVADGDPALCRHHEQWIVQWPADRGRPWSGAWSDGTAAVRWSIAVSDVIREEPDDFRVMARGSIDSAGSTGEESRSGSIFFDARGDVQRLAMDAAWSAHPFAIGRTWHPGLQLVASVAPLVGDDDALVDRPVATVLADHGPRLLASLREGARTTRWHSARVPMAGIRFAEHLGAAVLPLLAAVVLLAQCFRRRAIALVGVAIAVLLVAVALDRMVLAVDLGRLDDATAPLAARLVAARQASDSFFHRATAMGRIGAVAADPGAPQALRDVCAALQSPSAR